MKMTEIEIARFEKIQTQLESLHLEISALAKKSQNDALNKFKLKFVNKTLKEANELLTKSFRPYDDFEIFDEEDLPTNSDVTMILGQYLNCMENLRSENIKRKDRIYDYKLVGQDWHWIGTSIKTAEPKKLKK